MRGTRIVGVSMVVVLAAAVVALLGSVTLDRNGYMFAPLAPFALAVVLAGVELVLATIWLIVWAAQRRPPGP